jgi:HPt (histidine-containing phosphotransfer) domain-containing protein
MENTPTKIDLAYLYLLSNGNKEFEQKLLTGSVESVNELMNNLQRAWESRDAAGVKKSAHSIISLAAITGIPFAEGLCRKIDKAFADDLFHPEYEPVVKDIVSCWPVAYEQLKSVLHGSSQNN